MKRTKLPIDSIVVYLATLLGVIVSEYIPVFKSGGNIDLHLHYGRLLLGAFVAFLIVLNDEDDVVIFKRLPNETDEQRSVRLSGKKNNFKKRIRNALAHGMCWTTAAGIV